MYLVDCAFAHLFLFSPVLLFWLVQLTFLHCLLLRGDLSSSQLPPFVTPSTMDTASLFGLFGVAPAPDPELQSYSLLLGEWEEKSDRHAANGGAMVCTVAGVPSELWRWLREVEVPDDAASGSLARVTSALAHATSVKGTDGEARTTPAVPKTALHFTPPSTRIAAASRSSGRHRPPLPLPLPSMSQDGGGSEGDDG
jgi:hypothetical protein